MIAALLLVGSLGHRRHHKFKKIDGMTLFLALSCIFNLLCEKCFNAFHTAVSFCFSCD